MARLRKRKPADTGKFKVGYGRMPRGAFVSPSEAGQSGAMAGLLASIGEPRRKATGDAARASLLKTNIETGKLNFADLSGADSALLGGSGSQFAIRSGAPQPFSVGGFLGNLLGERGLEGALVHLPGGVYEMGKSAVHDVQKSTLGKVGAIGGFAFGGPVGALLGGAVGGAIGRGGESESYKNVIKPIGESYAYTYGGKGARGKNFAERFYEAPLGPILDIATIASVGAGGAAKAGNIASRAARRTARPTGEFVGAQPVIEMSPLAERVEQFGSRLGSITSREGRRSAQPFELDPNAADIFEKREGVKLQSPSVPTQFSHRPLMKWGIQKPFDILASSKIGRTRVPGTAHSLEGMRDIWMSNKAQNVARSKLGLKTQLEVQKTIQPLVRLANHVPADEQMAWFLAAQGITSKTKLREAAYFWESSQAGLLETGANAAEHGIDRSYIDFLADLRRDNPQTARIISLLENPTPAMIKLDRAWQTFLDEVGPKLVDEAGNPLIDEQEQLRRAYMVRNTLSKADNLEGAKRAFETWRYNEGLVKLKAIEKDIDLTDMDPAGKAAIRDYGYPITPKYVPHSPARGMEFGTRPGLVGRLTGEEGFPELYNKGIRKRPNIQGAATESLQQPFQPYLQPANEQLFRAGAVRMDIRTLVNTASQITRDLIFNDFNPAHLERIAVRDATNGAPMEFKNQGALNHATGKDTREIVWVPKAMQKYYEGHVDALAVLAQGLKDLDKQGVKLEHMDADGIQPILDQLKEHAGIFTKDFVGTAEATGYGVPRTYLDKALQHAKAAEGPTSFAGRHWASLMNVWRTWVLALMPRWWINTAVGSFFLATVHGTWEPKTFALALKLMRGKSSPKLQQLFDQYAAHVRLGGVAGAERLEPGGGAGQAVFPTRKLYNAVQHIEDYFRTAAFVKQLKREERGSMVEAGDAMNAFTPFRFWAEDEKHIAQLMSDHLLVDSAIDEVNRFFYNYLQLGPTERLYVRQFIPFWGWYKFITKFVWRLPVAYPGRANIIAHLGMVGQEQEEELGVLPDYLKGAIFLNKDTKHLKFMSTFGINPMAQFANPFSLRGGVPGILNTSQLNPVAQAGMQALGWSPLGGETGIAPDAGIGYDFFGQPIDVRRGKEVDLQQRRSFQRFFGSLLRSVPQVRLGEMAVPTGGIPIPGLGGIKGTGGRPAYPESIPFLRERPIPVRDESLRHLDNPLSLFMAYTGLQPRQKNLAHYQSTLDKRIAYAKSKLKRDLKRYRQGSSK